MCASVLCINFIEFVIFWSPRNLGYVSFLCLPMLYWFSSQRRVKEQVCCLFCFVYVPMGSSSYWVWIRWLCWLCTLNIVVGSGIMTFVMFCMLGMHVMYTICILYQIINVICWDMSIMLSIHWCYMTYCWWIGWYIFCRIVNCCFYWRTTSLFTLRLRDP